jgi:hypothetical protein
LQNGVLQRGRNKEPFAIDGRFVSAHGGAPSAPAVGLLKERAMHGLIYLIGLIVVILFILSFLGLR